MREPLFSDPNKFAGLDNQHPRPLSTRQEGIFYSSKAKEMTVTAGLWIGLIFVFGMSCIGLVSLIRKATAW
jgi:hypothetical protein